MIGGGFMKFFENKIGPFSVFEYTLWAVSIATATVSHLICGGQPLTLAASLIGVTSLIFNAKGYPAGQLLMVLFSLLYGIISYSFSYYGEMMTYLFMTMPMAISSFVSWVRNPYQKGSSQVRAAHVKRRELCFMWVAAGIVTFIFFFILRYFNTANLFFSTLSVTTSFVAVYLTYKRSPLYALGYAANDVVLIILWTLASIEDISFCSVVVCFVVFLINDLYGFFAWEKMKKAQARGK